MAPPVAHERPAMRSSLSHQCLAALLSAVIVSYPTRAHAFMGSEDIELAVLVSQSAASLEQLRASLAAAREQVQFARDVYAGVNDFRQFDPQAFLDSQQQQWLSQVPLAQDVSSFVQDITANGLNGGRFSASDLYYRVDAYHDAYRRHQAEQANGGKVVPYDARAALGVSREAEAALANPATRAALANQPVPDVADGLFAVDAAKADPALLSLYMQRRAQAKEAEYQAFKLYAESMGASPGKAQQLAAMAAGLSAQELARVDDKLGQSLSLQQLQRQEEAGAKASERRETDALWNNIEKTATDAYKPPQRGDTSWEDFK